jgi:hypothetical protein
VHNTVQSQLAAQQITFPSASAFAHPKAGTEFKGETLRSMLLNAYGWWKVSQITYIASLVMFGLGTVSFLGGVFGIARIRRERPGATLFAPPAIEQISEATREAGTSA